MENTRNCLKSLFASEMPLIGVIHLPPLPGSPFDKGEALDIIERFSINEALKYQENGFDGVILENASDGPKLKTIDPTVVAAMSAISFSLKKKLKIPIGISAGYDAIGVMAIAAVSGAVFIRVPIYVEASVTIGGIIEGHAGELLRYRKYLDRDIAIFADVYIKHSSPLSRRDLLEAIVDAANIAKPDGVIVTGTATGNAPCRKDIESIREHVDVPILIGSGTTAENICELSNYCSGFIVGTYCKDEGTGLLDTEKISQLVNIVKMEN